MIEDRIIKEKKEENNKFSLYYALSLAMQLGINIVVPIVGFTFLGFYIEKKIHSGGFFIGFGIVLGIIIMIYQVKNSITPLLIDKNKND